MRSGCNPNNEEEDAHMQLPHSFPGEHPHSMTDTGALFIE